MDTCGQGMVADDSSGDMQGFFALPDELVHTVLTNVHSTNAEMPSRTVLHQVCKKWREILYLQGVHHLLLTLRSDIGPALPFDFQCLSVHTQGGLWDTSWSRQKSLFLLQL